MFLAGTGIIHNNIIIIFIISHKRHTYNIIRNVLWDACTVILHFDS